MRCRQAASPRPRSSATRPATIAGRRASETGGDTPELRYAVANSLAWTGRYDAALQQYRALLGTAYDSRARVGIANIRLWNGDAPVAEAGYREVLANEPANAEAREGLALAGRELRPALTFRLARTQDNQDFTRDEAWLTYRKWSADRAWRFEASALRDWDSAPGIDATRNSVQGSAWAPTCARRSARCACALTATRFPTATASSTANSSSRRHGNRCRGGWNGTAASMAGAQSAQMRGTGRRRRPMGSPSRGCGAIGPPTATR